MGERLPEIFVKAVDVALASGAEDIKRLPGIHRLDLGAGWTMETNGHAEEMHGVPPYSVAVLRWWLPRAIVNAAFGQVVGGPGAEDEVIAVLDAALARYRAEKGDGADA